MPMPVRWLPGSMPMMRVMTAALPKQGVVA